MQSAHSLFLRIQGVAGDHSAQHKVPDTRRSAHRRLNARLLLSSSTSLSHKLKLRLAPLESAQGLSACSPVEQPKSQGCPRLGRNRCRPARNPRIRPVAGGRNSFAVLESLMNPFLKPASAIDRTLMLTIRPRYESVDLGNRAVRRR